jgi:hypothetical protein
MTCDLRRLREGTGSGEIKADLQVISKLFQISACFLQTYPNKALAVLWDFNGLQGFQTECVDFQISCRQWSLFRPYSGRGRTAFPYPAPYGPERLERFAWLYDPAW